ncbi:hypothetical protein LVY72_03015 [Arthrobacter sp. I2-34]|uniref:Uncharacterized protein n=1 Tax=Arthrobacter hankyongi TaxID=2904801 RepID=A0ABS9L2L4_9MICC|nr:hypothetical protein [Arthrobacter hankyongi]MCG2620882.1 hypothetical protein [Arthrobacter hankyongi]
MDSGEQKTGLEELIESASESYVRRRRAELSEMESRFSARFASAADRLFEDVSLRAGIERLVTSTATGLPNMAAVEARYEGAVNQALADAGVETADVTRDVLSLFGRPEGSAFRGILFAGSLGLRENPDTDRPDERGD